MDGAGLRCYSQTMVEVTATVHNSAGIHCRPAAAIVKAFNPYQGQLLFRTSEGSCDPRSIMGLLSLCLEKGTVVHIEVEGPDEQATAQRLATLLETHFDFPQRLNSEDTVTLLDRADLPTSSRTAN